MSLSKLACVFALLLGGGVLLAFPGRASAQTNYYAPDGTEYSVAGSLLGDQMFPDVAINSSGGFVVWQDPVSDGNGLGLSAQRLDSTYSGTLSLGRVNVQITNDQQNAHVALLKNGGAAFVWQGGARNAQHIFARFLSPTNTWLTATDVVVSAFPSTFQITPALTVLNNSNVVVVWASYDEAGPASQLDVYGAIFSQSGVLIGNQFLINQFTSFNQRTPAVAALPNGGFVVAWVSEQERASARPSPTTYYYANAVPTPSVDIYARLYTSNGAPVAGEFPVNTNSFPCANPSIAVGSDGGFIVAWSQHDMLILTNGWDVFARPFSSAGAAGAPFRVNAYQLGDQFAPKIKAIDLDYLIVWTSMKQDGSREGVFGRYAHNNNGVAGLVGNEFQVNTTFVGQQMQPAVASDGNAWFDVVWTSFTGGTYGFDLFAQRYANVSAVLPPMSAPFVYAPFNFSNNVYVPQLQVSWPVLSGLAVSNFEVYVDFTNAPTTVLTGNQWVMSSANGLTPASLHAFQVAYVTTSGRQSPISPATYGTTWSGLAYNGLAGNGQPEVLGPGGIPVEWMQAYYGTNTALWPANINAPLKPGSSFTLLKVFFSGADPLLPATWLTTSMVKSSEGWYLSWNPQPGQTYQVQETTNLTTWSNVGTARYAAGTNDSIYVGGKPVGYFRVQLVQ